LDQNSARIFHRLPHAAFKGVKNRNTCHKYDTLEATGNALQESLIQTFKVTNPVFRSVNLASVQETK